MKENIGPKFLRFFNPILEVLRELGGTGNSSEVVDLVIEKLEIPEEKIEEKLKSGASRIKNQIAWARIYLVKNGLLDDASDRGIWSLTEEGFNSSLSFDESYHLFKKIHSKFTSKSSSKSSSKINNVDEDEINIAEINYQEELLSILKKISPEGFERICQRLLRESGFKKVIVTGKSGDGGIDGEGILEVNPLMSFKVLFQSKRYSGSVGSGVVRDFRGAMLGRADKGIIITTGTFTKDAKKEAIRDGAPPIELIDGESLVELFEKTKLGLKPKVIYDVDYSFFDEYLN